MIIKEYYKTRTDGVRLMRTYSDLKVCIKNETGNIYDEAIDPDYMIHTYEETDIPIPQESEEEK